MAFANHAGGASPPSAMTRDFSLYLDFLRVSAALVVFLHHFAFDKFSDGYLRLVNLHNFGQDGVIVFFVLSGLIIAFCGDEKDATAGRFAFSRATRLFSVAVPALFIGYAADRIGSTAYPEFYESIGFTPISLWEQLAHGLSFTSEWWWKVQSLGTNGPFWSLSYEATYYALFAIVFYFRTGWKWLLVLVLGLLAGPAILLLLPCWLIGWGTWRLISSGRANLSFAASAALAAGPLLLFVLILLSRLQGKVRHMNWELLPRPFLEVIENRAIEFQWAWVLALLVACHILGVYGLLRHRRLSTQGQVTEAVRWLAGGSFSIYLLHYPLLHVLSPLLRDAIPGALRIPLLAALTLAICLLVAALFERTLGSQRKALKGIFRGSEPDARAIPGASGLPKF